MAAAEREDPLSEILRVEKALIKQKRGEEAKRPLVIQLN